MKEQNTSVKYTRSEIDTLPDETDWERVAALTDEDINAAASSDPDAPPTDASFWKDATVVMPENMEERKTVIDLNFKDGVFRYERMIEYERAIESKNNQEQYGRNEAYKTLGVTHFSSQ